MPALVAVQHEPRVTAFFNQLVTRGKKPLQAYVAVMRKLLHAIYGKSVGTSRWPIAKVPSDWLAMPKKLSELLSPANG